MLYHNDEVKTVSIAELADILQLQYETVRIKVKKEPNKFPPVIASDVTNEKRFLYTDVVDWLRGRRW